MTISLAYLGWTLVLAIAQVMIAAAAKRRQDGLQWASGNRDAQPAQYTGLAARMTRAQANLYEALPIFAAAVLLAHAAGRENHITAWGSGLFFWARLAYIPAYGWGLVPWRSVIWGVSVVGLLLVLCSLL